ncbi:MAG: hypothetical protein ACRCX7_08910 [Cetobacterium sp.]|uniref:hypothetical protein n=1 Tax=Cetobacterium sp. TaxID=2071632 RepID=UPI003F2F9B3F
MSMKVLKTAWEIEERIKSMNKAEIVEYMKGYLKQAEINGNDNKNVVHHTCLQIKRKLQSIETELFILETIGVQDKKVGKAYLLDELERIKERIEKIYEV